MAQKKYVTKERQQRFKAELRSSCVEKDVENAYRSILGDALQKDNCTQTSPFQCDGFFSGNMFLRLLLEAKYEENYLDKKIKCETIAQALAYMKRFEEAGELLPNVILCADRNECFLVSGSPLYQYLKENYDWTIAPSAMAAKCPDLVIRLVNDSGITPYTFSVIDPGFDFNDVCRAIDQLALSGDLVKVEANEANIRTVYEQYLRTFFPSSQQDNYTPNLLVSAFIRMLTGDPECYIHPHNPNELLLTSKLIDGKEVITKLKIDGAAFYAFFSRFRKDYSPAEKDKLNEIADRLIEETSRRFQGSFWTPTVWANRAHEMLDEVLGEDWSDEYIVWDACCGSLNLTRDRKFAKRGGMLFCSTLFQEELDLGRSYNPEAIKFQYDFLNDDIDATPLSDYRLLKMPKQLWEALCERKPIVFLMNPPYVTANNAGAKGTSKQGVAKTRINKLMSDEGAGRASQQLFAQFFWRILKLKRDFLLDNVVIAFFCKPIFMSSGEYYQNFQTRLFSEFSLLKGNLFTAGDFADVSDAWGITFSIFQSRDKIDSSFEKKWNLQLEKLNGNAIEKIGGKTFYSFPDEESCSFWIREPIKDFGPYGKPYPQLSSALSVSKATKKPRGSLKKGALGYLVNVANNVMNSANDVYFLSSSAYKGNGCSVHPENFERVISNFAARKLVVGNWINDKDCFHIPDVEHPRYQEWLTDSAVFFAFNNACYAASARNFPYMNECYNLQNEMFFASRELVLQLANVYHNDEIYHDAKNDHERFMYLWLKRAKEDNKLSVEANKVWTLGIKVLEDSFQARLKLSNKLSSMHLNTWDAGWYQIKQLTKQQDLKSKADFDLVYKELCEKMRPFVYELGFLSKD